MRLVDEHVMAAQAAANPGEAREHFQSALDHYGGELLPDSGPTDWVVAERRRLIGVAADAAVALAQLQRDDGDERASIETCERGLEIDPYRDELWRLLLDATEASGDQAAHGVAKARYADVLEELGVEAPG